MIVSKDVGKVYFVLDNNSRTCVFGSRVLGAKENVKPKKNVRCVERRRKSHRMHTNKSI